MDSKLYRNVSLRETTVSNKTYYVIYFIFPLRELCCPLHNASYALKI